MGITKSFDNNILDSHLIELLRINTQMILSSLIVV